MKTKYRLKNAKSVKISSVIKYWSRSSGKTENIRLGVGYGDEQNTDGPGNEQSSLSILQTSPVPVARRLQTLRSYYERSTHTKSSAFKEKQSANRLTFYQNNEIKFKKKYASFT